jgi:hypothetical protein
MLFRRVNRNGQRMKSLWMSRALWSGELSLDPFRFEQGPAADLLIQRTSSNTLHPFLTLTPQDQYLLILQIG